MALSWTVAAILGRAPGGDRFRRHIEAAYVTMWERWQRGERPQGFAVEPSAGAPETR
jgi:hypothetical protein